MAYIVMAYIVMALRLPRNGRSSMTCVENSELALHDSGYGPDLSESVDNETANSYFQLIVILANSYFWLK